MRTVASQHVYNPGKVAQSTDPLTAIILQQEREKKADKKVGIARVGVGERNVTFCFLLFPGVSAGNADKLTTQASNKNSVIIFLFCRIACP